MKTGTQSSQSEDAVSAGEENGIQIRRGLGFQLIRLSSLRLCVFALRALRTCLCWRTAKPCFIAPVRRSPGPANLAGSFTIPQKPPEPSPRFDLALSAILKEAQSTDEAFIDVSSKRLRDSVIGPGTTKGLAACERAMRAAMIPGDCDISSTPDRGVILIRFRLPR